MENSGHKYGVYICAACMCCSCGSPSILEPVSSHILTHNTVKASLEVYATLPTLCTYPGSDKTTYIHSVGMYVPI